MSTPPTDTAGVAPATRPPGPASLAGTTVAPVAPDTADRGFADETRALLYRRLLQIHAIFATAAAFLLISSLLGFEEGGLQGDYARVSKAVYPYGLLHS